MVRLRLHASSGLSCCLITTGAGEAGKMQMLSSLLYIYIYMLEQFVLFTKLQYIRSLTFVLRMYCKYSKEC